MRRRHVLLASGTVLATALPTTAADDDPAIQYEPARVYQGQPVTASGDDLEPDEVYELRAVDQFSGETAVESSFVEELTTDESGTLEIQTDEYDVGDYFLAGPGLPEEPTSSDTFSTRVQKLDAEFVLKDQHPGEDRFSTELDYQSNRGTHPVTISADGDLTQAELIDLFIEGTDLELYDEPDGDAIEILLSSESSALITFEKETVEEGEYTFTFEASDTTAEDTASLTVDYGTVDADTLNESIDAFFDDDLSSEELSAVIDAFFAS